MTTNFKFIANVAALAEASYADLTKGLYGALTDPNGFLKEKSFSDTQATDFVDHWSVVVGSHQPDMPSGFSATLFKGIGDNNELAGEYVLAIRGTAGAVDLLADGGDIILDGLAVDQIIDLYNYLQRLTHPGNYTAALLTKVDVPSGIPPEEYAKQNGFLTLRGSSTQGPFEQIPVYQVTYETRSDGIGALPAGQQVHVTGHSLGGHLAATFSRLFPALTLDATMINGAGFAEGFSLPTPNSFNVDNLFHMLGGANQFDASKITNYIGTEAMDFVAEDWFIGLEQPGGIEHVTTESFSDVNTFGHGAGQMTNTLSVMALFGQLSAPNSLSVSDMNNLMDKAANSKTETFEQLVNALSRMFDVPEIEDTTADSTTAGREALFNNIVAIQNSHGFKDLIGKVSIDSPAVSANPIRYADRMLPTLGGASIE